MKEIVEKVVHFDSLSPQKTQKNISLPNPTKSDKHLAKPA